MALSVTIYPMIDRIWSGQSPWWRLLLPLSWLYGLISGTIRLSYRLGLRQSWRAPLPVIVIGNLTVGGNGKTPAVIWLVEQLQQRGFKPGVVSRGYGGKAPHYPFIVTCDTCAQQSGDEPLLVFQRTGVPVAVAPNRAAAIRALIAQQPLDLIITDDGLQHYALQRDLEIVVIDGARRFGNGWWLPAGPMRERASRLRQVSAIITNGGQPQPGEIAMRLQFAQAVNLATGEQRPPAALTNIVALAGIGHPARFFTMLQEQGMPLLNTISLADHQMLTAHQLQALLQPGQTLLMTEKDAVKYRAFAKDSWWYLPVSARLDPIASQPLLARILALLPVRH